MLGSHERCRRKVDAQAESRVVDESRKILSLDTNLLETSISKEVEVFYEW